MVDLAEKPTSVSIKEMHQHLQRIWNQAHGIWKTIDTYYERTFRLWEVGSNRPNLHPMKPRSIVDTALDQLMGHEAQIQRFGEDEGKAEERDQVEKAMNAIFRQAALQEVSLSHKQAGKHMLLYGYAITEDSIDGPTLQIAQSEKPEQEGEDDDDFKMRIRLWEHRQKTAMPFRIRAPHPTTVLMDPMHKDPRVAIKVDGWTVQDLVDITTLRKEQGRGDVEIFDTEKSHLLGLFHSQRNSFDLIKAFEYWTIDWHALMTEQQLLIVEPNTWGFVPFSHAFSGWGQEPSDRSRVSPAVLAVGMIQHAMDDLRMNAQAIAGRHNALLDVTFQKTGTTEEAAELEEQMATSDVINLPGGESSVWMLKAANLPRWLETLGNDINKDLEEGTFIRALSGVRDVGVSTVGQTAIQHTSGARKFVPINIHDEV